MGDPDLINTLEDSAESFSFKTFQATTMESPQPAKQLKPAKQKRNPKHSFHISDDAGGYNIISFGNPHIRAVGSQENLKFDGDCLSFENPSFSMASSRESRELKEENRDLDDSYAISKGSQKGARKDGPKAQDHVLAERKRRERMTQGFVALSSIIPKLKKMDKASILEDAINYIKELRERVNELEEAAESLVPARRTRRHVNEGSWSPEGNSSSGHLESLPEIEVKISGSNVLVRIYSRSDGAPMMKVVREMQKLNLSVVNSSTMPFVNSTLLATIVAEMGRSFARQQRIWQQAYDPR